MNEPSKHELLSAYLDDELSADERARVEQWLAADDELRRRLDELRAVNSGMKSLPTHALDEDLTERVLRAAEHRILAEPTPLAGQPEPTTPAEPLTARRLARRLLSPRAVVWSGVAVAVAILLTVFNHPGREARRDGDVAMNQKKNAGADSAIVMTPETGKSQQAQVEAPSREHDDLDFASESLSELATKSDGRATSPSDERFTHPAKRGLYEGERLPAGAKKAAASAPSSTAFKDHSRSKAKGTPRGYVEGKKTQAGAGRPGRSAAKSPAASELAEPVAKPSATNKQGSQSKAGRRHGDLDFGHVARKGPPPSNDRLNLTTVQRAVQNEDRLLVVNCALSPKALEEKAFTRTLDSNRIDLVDVEPDDQPLADHLVRNWTQAPPTTQQPGQLGDTLGAQQAASGLQNRANRGESVEESLARAAQTMTVRSLTTWQSIRDKMSGENPAEVVLVEGTPTQIMATVSALNRRKDMTVSIEPRQSAAHWRYNLNTLPVLKLESSVEDPREVKRRDRQLDAMQKQIQLSPDEGIDKEVDKRSDGMLTQERTAGETPGEPRGTALRLGQIVIGQQEQAAPAQAAPQTADAPFAPPESPSQQTGRSMAGAPDAPKRPALAPANKPDHGATSSETRDKPKGGRIIPPPPAVEMPVAGPMGPAGPQMAEPVEPPVQTAPVDLGRDEKQQSGQRDGGQRRGPAQGLGSGMAGGMGGMGLHPTEGQSQKKLEDTTTARPQRAGRLSNLPPVDQRQGNQRGRAVSPDGDRLPRLQVLFVIQNPVSPPMAASQAAEQPPARKAKQQPVNNAK